MARDIAKTDAYIRIDQDVGDILNVADLVGALANFQQRIVAGRARIGGLNSRQCENRDRQPAVSIQFSPLMSWTTEKGAAVAEEPARLTLSLIHI